MSIKLKELKQSIKNAEIITLFKNKKDKYNFAIFPFWEKWAKIDIKLLNEITSELSKSVSKNFSDFDYIVSPEPWWHIWGCLVWFNISKWINIIRTSSSSRKNEIQTHRETGYSKDILYFNNFKKWDRVLIIDDIISTWWTLNTIIKTLMDLWVEVVWVQLIYSKSNVYVKYKLLNKFKIICLEKFN